MAKIYPQAQKVLIWLGAGSRFTHEALEYMRETSSEVETSSASNDQSVAHQTALTSTSLAPPHSHSRPSPKLHAMMSLLARTWFRRLWVVQEAVLGHHVEVACGDDIIDFDTFRDAVMALWGSVEAINYFDLRSPWYRGFRCVTRLFDIDEMHRNQGNVPLELLLEAVFYYSAKDSRDFVFGIQGIADSVDVLPRPDYTTSIEEVFTEAASGVLCRGSSLDLLSLSGIGPREQSSNFAKTTKELGAESATQLPTWVPDFRYPAYVEPISICNTGDWNAGGPLKNRPTSSESGLEVEAIILCQIKALGGILHCARRNALAASLKDARELVSSLKLTSNASTSDILWKTLIMGMDMDDEPAHPDLEIAFRHLTEDLDNQKAWKSITGNEYYSTLAVRSDSWRPFASDSYFGITYPAVKVDDYVCLLPGCRLPLVLRPCGEGAQDLSQNTNMQLVGWCYVDGVMHGEALVLEQERRKMMIT